MYFLTLVLKDYRREDYYLGRWKDTNFVSDNSTVAPNDSRWFSVLVWKGLTSLAIFGTANSRWSLVFGSHVKRGLKSALLCICNPSILMRSNRSMCRAFKAIDKLYSFRICSHVDQNLKVPLIYLSSLILPRVCWNAAIFLRNNRARHWGTRELNSRLDLCSEKWDLACDHYTHGGFCVHQGFFSRFFPLSLWLFIWWCSFIK